MPPQPSVHAGLVADLYELTMAAAYHAGGLNHEASFELFVRKIPRQRRFLVAAGLEDALDGLENLRYEPGDIDYLASLGMFDDSFLERLAGFRFTGDVWAVPEGEVVFGNEPLVRVTAPLPEAQVVETFLLNRIASHTMLASKAARVALACGPRAFVDFSARRDQGVDSAMGAARAAWISGAAGTSLVAAGRRWGIPLSGTMAHSFIMSFDEEAEAFRTYARSFPHGVVLLIDTYDTIEGARRTVEVARELADEGITISGVRLDSGDLGALSLQVRDILDAGGLTDAQIVASGDLDEHRIALLRAEDAAIDAFGVGTQLGTSGDAPWLGAVYKLVEDVGGPRMKLAEGKVTLPSRKQVWRLDDHDVLSLHDEDILGGRPLLRQVMANGSRIEEAESLATLRARCTEALSALPRALRSLDDASEPLWDVELSPGLRELTSVVRAGHEEART